jgi:GT2 family glycosyltransferase
MHCAVIVLAWNGEKYLPACLDALIAQNDVQAELIVVDNASTDTSREIVQRYAPQVRLIANPENLGFSGGNNVGLAATNAEVVVLLNQDTEVRNGWLRAILNTFLENQQIGIVGCKALYPTGQIQHAGAKINPIDAVATHIGQGEADQGQYNQSADVDYVTGAAFAIHRRVLLEIGNLDEGFNPAIYEEVDYCYRARRSGFRVVYQPQAVLIHHESKSLPKIHYGLFSLAHRNRLRFVLRHWPAETWPAFWEAELLNLQTNGSLPDILARGRAYLESTLQWSKISNTRQNNPLLGGRVSPAQIQHMQSELLLLWKTARQRAFSFLTFEQLSGGQPPLILVNPIPAGLALWEPQIRSTVPLIGPVVDWFRDVFFNTFVRPHVIPILQRLALQQHLMITTTQSIVQTLHDETQALVNASLIEREE